MLKKNKFVIAFFCVAMFTTLSLIAEGLLVAYPKIDGIKYDAEFQRFSRTRKYFKDNYDINISTIPYRPFVEPRYSEKSILKLLTPFNVFILAPKGCESIKMTPALGNHAKKVGIALKKYVEAGGGLWLDMRSVRYPNDDDEEYWNIVLEAFDAKMLHEGVFDKKTRFDAHTMHKDAAYFSTTNIEKHPITQGVKRVCLPLHDYFPSAGVHAMKYGKEWKIIVRGNKSAQSYLINKNNIIDMKLSEVGTYDSAPPILAVKSIGKGRVVLFPLTKIHWFENLNNPIWLNTVEFAGDRKNGFGSDTIKLIAQALKWAGEPGLENPDIGTHKIKAYKRIQYPVSVNWDKKKITPPNSSDVRGVFGLVSNYGGGKSTVADYAKAAKKAGFSFIVFSDPLEKLSKEKLKSLKQDCASVSEANLFYACPGVEYSDSAGLRWVQWGEKVVFPGKTYFNVAHKRTYPYWDGKVVHQRGAYAVACGFSGSAIISYDQLRKAKVHPENLWWYFNFIPFAYDGNKQIANNVSDLLDGLDNLTWTALVSYQKIDSADKLTKDAPIWTSLARGGNMKPVLNKRCNPQHLASACRQYVSQGPEIRQWAALNSQMESNWRYTRGAQRVPLGFDVYSEQGIRDVKVHDGNSGVIRLFKADGAKELARKFELVHDKQHWLILEVTDMNAKKAFSHVILLWAYKQGLARCGDNLNILGATGLCWHPDRSEMFPGAKTFQNGWKYSIMGWDMSGPAVPQPHMRSPVMLQTKNRTYPERYKEKKIIGNTMDVLMSNYQLQIAEKKYDFINDACDTTTRNQPALASPPVDLGSTKAFDRRHRIISLRDRIDYYTVWNHRRANEGKEKYRGGIIWHEGEIRIKKDLELSGNVPIPLAYMEIPVDHSTGTGTITIIKDGKGRTDVLTLSDANSNVRKNGTINAGGYILRMPTIVGYHVFYAPSGMEFSYDARMPGRVTIGLGENGQKLKAGTVIQYRYAVASIAVPKTLEGNGMAEQTALQLNLGKIRPMFENITFKTGTGISDEMFIQAKAERNECLIAIKGKEKELVDRAFIIEGLEDNGCTAVYTKNRPWFRFVANQDGKTYFQENIDYGNEIWVGNVFVADNAAIKFTLIVDGQHPGAKPRLEVHNPTEKELNIKIHSPAGTPGFGGYSKKMRIKAGHSQFVDLKWRKL